MTDTKLVVWRDCYGAYEKVGSLFRGNSGWEFAYSPEYAGQAISARLPVRESAFSPQETSAFFSALSPEGPVKATFLRELHAEGAEYEPLLRRLNDESQGGLVFSVEGETPGLHASYQPLDWEFFERFAASPRTIAFETMGKARLSLAGAKAKVGLYRSPDGRWFLPLGAAPSNCIVKAGGDAFPFEVINEALCLETARRCDYDVPTLDVLHTKSGPLLTIERYDRIIPESPLVIDGLPAPKRLHQEDLCQLSGISPAWKYEPTGSSYLGLGAQSISRTCANPFGEVQLFVSCVLFDYLIGNCDNHLKNYSVIYSEDWRSLRLAPRYDIVNTTVYPSLYTEMGISLQPSRSIFGLSRKSVEDVLAAANLPTKLGMDELDELAAVIPQALEAARDDLVERGFPKARRVASVMLDGILKRAAFSFDEHAVRTLV